jgi:branched-chain amino acid transport system substrate-binding protein
MEMKLIKIAILHAALGLVPLISTAHAAEFVIGTHNSLTGATARVGSEMNEGVLTAARYFNDKYPEHKFKVLTLDDESQPAKSIAAVEKLVSEGVLAFSAGYGTNVVGPASEAAAKAGLVYVTSGGVGDGLTKRGLKTFFRITNTPGYSNTFIGILGDLKVQSVSIVHSTKESSAGLADALIKGLPAKGIKVYAHAFEASTTDFKPVINKVKLQDKPELLLMIGLENDYVGILRAAKLLKPKVKAIMAPWGMASPRMSAEFPDLVPGVFGTTFIASPPVYKTTEGTEFAKLYRTLYKKEPDYLAQFGFVQTQLLFEAIMRAHKAGTLKQPDGIAAEMRKTDRETLTGRIRFDANGDYPDFMYRMGQHQDGGIAIVWPAQHATAKMRFPALPWN